MFDFLKNAVLQLCIEEAAKRGFSEEKYREMLFKIYKKSIKKDILFWKELPVTAVPKTSCGK